VCQGLHGLWDKGGPVGLCQEWTSLPVSNWGMSPLNLRIYCSLRSIRNLAVSRKVFVVSYTIVYIQLYTVSKKSIPPLACYNFDAREWVFIFFGRNVTDEVGNQKTLYYATSNNLCFCTTFKNVETWKSHFSLNWIVLYTQCTYALSSWKKKMSSVMCLIASNICWDSRISH